jgi:PKD domain
MNRIVTFSIAVVFALLPLFTSAQSTAQLEQQIADLLTQTQQYVNSAQGQQDQGTAYTDPSNVGSGSTMDIINGTARLTLPRDIQRGSKGADVSRLQVHLGLDTSIYPDRQVTSFYGPLTEVAVQKFQIRCGIVRGGDYSSTGYGRVGPFTRRALQYGCAALGLNPGQPTQAGALLTLSNSTGPAPHSVTAQVSVNTTNSCEPAQYVVSFGDGSFAQNIPVPSGACTSVVRTINHTYTTPGTYVVSVGAGGARTQSIVTVTSAGSGPGTLQCPAFQLPTQQCTNSQWQALYGSNGCQTGWQCGGVNTGGICPAIGWVQPTSGCAGSWQAVRDANQCQTGWQCTVQSTSAYVRTDKTAVGPGQNIGISWNVPQPSEASDVALRISLQAVNESTKTEALALRQGINGSYTWSVPADPNNDQNCFIADADRICTKDLKNGLYRVAVEVYTPGNACFGYCSSANQPRYLSTYYSDYFTYNGGSIGTDSVVPNTTQIQPGGTVQYRVKVNSAQQCTTETYRIEFGNGVGATLPYSSSNQCQVREYDVSQVFGAAGTYIAKILKAGVAVLSAPAVTVGNGGGGICPAIAWQIPPASECSAGTWQVVRDSNQCQTGWQCVPTSTGGAFIRTNIANEYLRNGSTVNITWGGFSFTTDTSNYRARISLVGTDNVEVGEGGITRSTALDGSYSWVIPAQPQTVPCLADADQVCLSNLRAGNQYKVKIQVYSPANACFGYCAPGSNQPTILTTLYSVPFTYQVSTTGSADIGIALVGTRQVTVSFQRPSPCSSYAINWGDGYVDSYALPINAANCVANVTPFTVTHTYQNTGSYTIDVDNAGVTRRSTLSVQ